jgi:hypothetical protein
VIERLWRIGKVRQRGGEPLAASRNSDKEDTLYGVFGVLYSSEARGGGDALLQLEEEGSFI